MVSCELFAFNICLTGATSLIVDLFWEYLSGLACPNMSKHLTMLEYAWIPCVNRCTSMSIGSLGVAQVAKSDPHRLLPRSGWTSQRVKWQAFWVSAYLKFFEISWRWGERCSRLRICNCTFSFQACAVTSNSLQYSLHLWYQCRCDVSGFMIGLTIPA